MELTQSASDRHSFFSLAVALTCMLILGASGLFASPFRVANPGGFRIAYSSFDSDTEGWRVVDMPDNGPFDTVKYDYSATYNATTGNPDGCVSTTDPSSYTFWWAAPEAFLGNKVEVYGGELDFDMKSVGGDYWNTADIALVGAGLVLVYDMPTNPTDSWTTLTVPLLETGWKIGSLTGTPVTMAQFRSVLAQLSQLYIRGEFRLGSETCYLDNVGISKNPLLTSIELTVNPGAGYSGSLSKMMLNYSLSGSESYSGALSFDDAGVALIYALTPGVYDLNITGSHWLKRIVAAVDANNSTQVMTSLANGDADGGGSVNLFDFVVLDSTFGSADAMGDLDGDGMVNLFDYVIIDNNFGALADL